MINISRTGSKLLLFFLTACFLIGFSTNQSFGQATTAAVLGTITDPSGAALQNTTVTLTNLGTNQAITAQSNDTGGYIFDNLAPGNYHLTFVHEGFQTSDIPSIALAAGDRHRVDLKLVPGGATTTVEVSTSAPLLQTDSSTLASTVTEQAVQNLPLNGRNYIQLAQVVPGANEGPPAGLSSGQRPDDRRQSSSISVNGQSDVINDQMIDGMDNNERIIGTIGVRPSIDAIAELRVLTNSYEADQGRAAGAVLNIITKSGTNQFHGSAYEYFRNDKLNTVPFQFGAHNPNPELRQNQFGGSVGGPIIKDRTFFFADIEEFRLVKGVAPSSLIVPTLFEEQNPGNFSDAIPKTSTGASACVPDPTPGTPVPSKQTTGCVYDTNTGALIPSNIIPANELDPAGLDYLALYPAPNVGADSYVGSRNDTQYSTVYDIRIDHKIATNDSIFGRYTQNSVTTFTAPSLPIVTKAVAGITGIDPEGNNFYGQAPQTARNIQLNYSHTFTPQLIMELAAGWTYINNLSDPLDVGVNPNTAFGQPGINFSTATSALGPVAPSGEVGLGFGGYFTPLEDKDNTYEIKGQVLYTKGQQSITVGAALTRRVALSLQDNEGEGYFTFQSGLPGLVSGFFSASTRNNDLFPPYYQTWEPSFFFQDDWHVSPKLTLNLGARYDVFTPFTEVHNHISNFDFATLSIVQAGVDGASRAADIKTDYSNFAPRLGFAYTLHPGTVIRGGTGLAFFPENLTSASALKNQPFSANYGTCTSVASAGCPATYTRLIDGLPLPVETSPSVLTGNIPEAIDFNFRSGYLEQFNLTLQQEVHGNTVTVAYVGALGRHQYDDIGDVNREAPNSTGAPNLRPYYAALPNISTITELFSNGASNYNSLQAEVARRFSHGFGYDVNYTWAHNLDNVPSISGGGGGGTGQVLATRHIDDYGNADLDEKNRLAFTADYALPFGQSFTGIKAAIAKGWQFNTLLVWAAGLPTNPTNTANVSNTSPNGSGDRPDQTLPNSNLSNRTIDEYFNTAAYVTQASGHLGDTRRNQIFGPHYRHADASIFKDFSMVKQTTLQFRAEAYNIANQTNFSNPNMTLGDSNFGFITTTNVNYNPRIYQFVLRYQF